MKIFSSGLYETVVWGSAAMAGVVVVIFLLLVLRRYLAERQVDANKRIDAAITRGEVSPDVDSEYVLDLIAAPVFWRICGRREQVTPAYLDRVVDTVLHALGSPRA